jgi:cell division protein FtsI/penicillin-binding protein 2
LLLLLAFVVAMSGGMAMRLAYWQIGQQGRLDQLASDSSTVRRVIAPVRGTIYDRTGTIVLARTIMRYRVVASPESLSNRDRARVGDALVDYLGLKGDEEEALRSAMASHTYFVVVASNLDGGLGGEISRAIDGGGLPGITLEPQPVRVYPQAGGAPHTSLAAHVLGFVNASGTGQYGLEQWYDSLLAGRPEILLLDTTVSGPAGITVVDPGARGEDIRTTIDVGLQLKLEQEVFAAWVADKAKTVSAVVMDPKTGQILAEASYPSYDANLYEEAANQNPGLFVDPIISNVYEPGSVFKMLTASAALQTKTTALTTKLNDTAILKLADGQMVEDADRKAKGWMTFADMVAWSRNVGVSRAALRLGKNTNAASAELYKVWRQYGIGQTTGVDLSGEATGIVRDPAETQWRQIDLANAAFGQGVAVTPLQVLRAYAAMANGGMLVTPHVAELDGELAKKTDPPAPSRRIISASLSQSLTGLMEHVVTTVPTYASKTYIPGYFVGGKTGTAQIWDSTLDHGKGGWKVDVYNYSFYGYVGHDGADLMIGTVIDEGTPTIIKQGVLDMPVQSYELFRRVATDGVICLQIPPNPNGPKAPKGQKNPTPQG